MAGENAAAVTVDLEKGVGAAAVIVEAMPCPADERLEEKQPFAWRPVAPFVAVALVGVAMVAVGLLLAYHYEKTAGCVGTALYGIGMLLAGIAAMAGAAVAGECGLQQLAPPD